ncbi:MAG: hypothetical protein EBV03_02100 [Proteobacteria bacterium]|nr:hypothetical protein [Pseudomonadota bacterium]
MMRLLALAMVALLATGCGNKGKLKSPSQVAHEQEKQERRAAKRAQKAEEGKEVGEALVPVPPLPTAAQDERVLYRRALPPTPSNDVGE